MAEEASASTSGLQNIDVSTGATHETQLLWDCVQVGGCKETKFILHNAAEGQARMKVRL